MGAPLAHVDAEFADEAWVLFKDIKYLQQSGVQVLRGTAQDFDRHNCRLTYLDQDKKEQTVQYDYLVLATGLRRTVPVVPPSDTKQAFLEDTRRQVERLSKAKTVVVVGGGELWPRTTLCRPGRLIQA